jgi:hypothetical protein
VARRIVAAWSGSGDRLKSRTLAASRQARAGNDFRRLGFEEDRTTLATDALCAGSLTIWITCAPCRGQARTVGVVGATMALNEGYGRQAADTAVKLALMRGNVPVRVRDRVARRYVSEKRRRLTNREGSSE